MTTVFGKLLESISSKKKPAAPKESLASERRAHHLLHPGGLSVSELNPNRLRVVVFRDDKGMKLPIFDSQLYTNEEGEEQCTRSLCDMRHGECLDSSSLSSSSYNGMGSSGTHSAGWATQSSKSKRGLWAKRPSTDSELLGEMMFGSMPMKVVGNTVKVHYIRSTDQLLLSKVFTSQRKPLAQCTITDFSDSCPLPSYSPAKSAERSFGSKLKSFRQVSPDVTRPHPSTLSVPISSPSHLSSSFSSSTHSPPSPLNSLTVQSISSSLSRRIQRSRSTSLENTSELYRKVLKPLDQSNGSTRAKRKYAIGFIICLSDLGKADIRHFQSFIFSHFTLIDAHLERLKLGVEEATGTRGHGVGGAEACISKAYKTFLQDFLSLYSSPRIESPAWLSLVSHVDRRKEVCLNYMEELASAIVELDTKETKYFLSSLLTAVLSHHLAWIFTVNHQNSSSDANRHGKHTSSSKSLGVLAESHPYNPLWAQLGDLFGSVSNPLKISRTIVTGRLSSTVCRLLYLLTYFIRCSEVEPSFSMDLMSPTSTALPSRTMEVTIPSSSSTSTAAAGSADTASYDVSQLDENDTYGSRASSVTVISDADHHSLLSPLASPVNQGADTPIIRPHPFGIRSTPASMCPSDYRKGSQSESDSADSLCTRGQEVTGSRQSKKTGDLSTSQATPTLPRKNSPLLSSSRPILHTSSYPAPEEGGVGSCRPPITTTMATNHTSSRRCNCHYGNPTTCATLACCESMGMCPIPDGFLTFDPTKKPCDIRAQSGAPCEFSSCKDEDMYSLGHLASCGLLGPLDPAPSAPPSHTSSLDSGYELDSRYEQSWSLTNSCTELANSFTVGSNRNALVEGGATATPSKCCACSENDSGRGSQCSCLKDKFPEQVLSARQGVFRPRAEATCVPPADSGRTSFYPQSQRRGGGPNSGSLPLSLRDGSAESAPTQAGGVAGNPPDPTCSLFPIKLSHYDPLEEVPSPDSTNTSSPDDSPGGLLSSPPDPQASLPIRKIQGHTHSIMQARAYKGNINEVSSDFGGLDEDPDSDLCTGEEFDSVSSASLPVFSSAETSIQSRASERQFGSSFVTSSIPVSCSPHTPSTCSTSATSSLHGHTHSPSHSLPQYRRLPEVVVIDYPVAGTTDTGSVCSEIDSGRGTSEIDGGRDTKTSMKMRDFDTRSLSQISEMSSNLELKSTHGSLNTLALLRHNSNHRANSSPPLLERQPRIMAEDEEVCSRGGALGSFGGANRSYPMLTKLHRLEERDYQSDAQTEKGEGYRSNKEDEGLILKSLHPSMLHQQLHRHDEGLEAGVRPSTLEHFDNFTDVPLPDLDEFHLDTPTHGRGVEPDTHRHQMSDFGHSLFVGLSPRYLPDFVLHGTTENADQTFQDKVLKDLAHTVKYSIIDEPVEYGVAIVADTDSWSVKVLAASKSVQTSDVIYGSGAIQAAKSVRQMLSSVRNMHCLRMPAEFCLSYVEDCLMSLSDRSVMLADTLTEKGGGDLDLNEALPRVAESLSIPASDINLLLPVAAVNCRDPDMAGRFNHLHMQQTLGKHFI